MNQASLHLLNSYLPLSETFIYNTLSGLEKFKPIIFTESLQNLDVFPLPNPEIKPHFFKSSKLKKAFAKLKGEYGEQFFPTSISNILANHKLVAHAHYGYRAIVCLKEVQKYNIPLVTQFYGFDLNHHKFLGRAKKQYKALFNIGARFLVEGENMAEKLVSLGFPPHKIVIHRIGIRLEKYLFRLPNWDKRNPINFLFIGRLVEKKGLLVLLEALLKIKQQINFKLTIVGGGPQKEEAQNFITSNQLEEYVSFAGFMTPTELLKLMGKQDLMIQPSQMAKDGDCEGGAPTTLLEAQAIGLPVITTFHDDIPNIVAKCYHPYLSKQADAAALSNNILKIIEDSNQWARFSKEGRDFVEEHHDIKKLNNNLERLYTELLQEN